MAVLGIEYTLRPGFTHGEARQEADDAIAGWTADIALPPPLGSRGLLLIKPAHGVRVRMVGQEVTQFCSDTKRTLEASPFHKKATVLQVRVLRTPGSR